MEKKKLVLFDFDGTITTKDTFPLFFKFTFGTLRYYSGFSLFAPLFLLYKLKLYEGGKLKERILSHYLKNKPQNEMQEMGKNYFDFLMKNNIIKREFLEKIEFYKKEGFCVAVVSASPDLWIKLFCTQYQIDCLCTELQYLSSVFSGKLKTKNCNGEEKRTRVKEHYNTNEFDEIVIYGDSPGDKKMMELATTKVWV
ncbi:MAG TPA: HAD family hydrolase [Bacteroidia bacterium]|jgi:phosphatidylglycerophosphatase C|nr:HAD family hydrolase [Bacteroidia bacterium]